MSRSSIAGVVLAAGAAQWLLVNIVAESAYPTYSVGEQPISDLGVGPTALLWNSSTILSGLTVLLGAYFVYVVTRRAWLTGAMFLLGLGALAAGLFPENSALAFVHTLGAFLAFAFGGLAAVLAYRLTTAPFRYFSAGLGAVALLALGSSPLWIQLGTGFGGVERMMVYPTVLWLIAFGGYLMGLSGTRTEQTGS